MRHGTGVATDKVSMRTLRWCPLPATLRLPAPWPTCLFTVLDGCITFMLSWSAVNLLPLCRKPRGPETLSLELA